MPRAKAHKDHVIGTTIFIHEKWNSLLMAQENNNNRTPVCDSFILKVWVEMEILK